MTLQTGEIRRFMVAKGLSREDMASRVKTITRRKCSRETIDRLLAGTPVRWDVLVAVAKLMGRRVDSLIAPDVATAA